MPLMAEETYAPPKAKAERIKLPVDLDQLCLTITNDYRDLGPFRRNRRDIVQQLGGKHYGDDCAPSEVPVNVLGMYFDLMTSACIAQNPRVMYSTFVDEQTATVEAMQDWANDEIVRMDAANVFARVMYDAICWVGILKVSLASPSDAEESGWDLKAGQPFMQSIDPDDVCFDLTAQQFDKCDYIACRYRIPVVVANELYAKGKSDKFTEDEESDYNFGGDQKIATLGRTAGNREEVEPHCTLWEVYLQKHKVVVLLRDNGGIPDATFGAVRVNRWIGPACGPYMFLGLGHMPGNLNPKAPAMDLIDLHRNLNAAWRKMLRQTRDYKKVLPYRGANTESAKRLKDAPDGEMFECDNAESLKEIETGGAGNAVWVMAQAMQEAFNFIGGNLALLGGRGAQSRTATQDKMLNENASAGVASMQDKFQTFIQKAFESMNWFWWNHPTKVMKSQWSAPSMPSFKINRMVGPWNHPTTPLRRRGPMPRIKVDVYSLARQTPQSRLAFINQTLQAIAPLFQLAMQQGVMPDMNALMELFSKYGDEPDLKKIFHYTEPPQQGPGGGQSEGPGKPVNTTRTYERYGSGDESTQAKANQLDTGFAQMEGPMNPNSGTAQ
jgi:hypothetical protein